MQDRTAFVVRDLPALALGQRKLAPAHRRVTCRSAAAGQHVKGCTDVPQKGVVGMTRSSLLKLEQTASRHPDYAFLGHIGAALHVLARRS
jgi:thiamine monophosphate synthase